MTWEKEIEELRKREALAREMGCKETGHPFFIPSKEEPQFALQFKSKSDYRDAQAGLAGRGNSRQISLILGMFDQAASNLAR